MLPARQIGLVDPDLIRRMQEASSAVAAYIDKKSLSTDEVRRIERMLDDAGITLLSESEILDIGDLGWRTYRAIRALAEEIAPGSRVHIHELCGDGIPVPVEINPDLIEEVIKSDKDDFIESLRRFPVAHLSKTSSKVLPLFICFEREASRLASDITTLCVKLLLICENTIIAGDHLVLQKVRFDPAKAYRHGVPEGPLFATLAGGGTVEIDGREITPDMVQTTSAKRIHIPGLERYT